MALSVLHNKVDNIADWTQADLDAQIALGNFPPGTLLADIVLASDWNDDHGATISTTSWQNQTDPQLAIDDIAKNVRGISIIDMANADRLMTVEEVKAQVLVVLNAGDGTKILSYPAGYTAYAPALVTIITGFAGNTFYVATDTIGSTVNITAPVYDLLIINNSGTTTPISTYNNSVSDAVFDSSWDASLYVPTKNAVYDAISSSARKGVVTSVTFSDEDTSVTVDVSDATITASDYISCSVIPNGLSAEEIAIQSITASASVTDGVGYSIYCAAPNGATGSVNILTHITRI